MGDDESMSQVEELDSSGVVVPEKQHDLSYQEDEQDDNVTKKLTFSQKWTRAIERLRQPINKVLIKVTRHAAMNPKAYVFAVIFLSVAFMVTGLLTNFSVDVDEDVLWTPKNSRPLSHGQWIDNDSGFPKEPRNFLLMVHSDSQNVLQTSQEGMERLFEALNVVRGTDNYDSVCFESHVKDENGVGYCKIFGATKFWNHSAAIFNNQVAESSNGEPTIISALSADFYPDQTPVDRDAILGNWEQDVNGTLTFAQSFTLRIDLPDTKNAETFEQDAIANIKKLRELWDEEASNLYRLELFAERSFSDEFTRAIVNDIPLVPIVFVVMSIFTCIVFFKKDKVQSRTLLGFGAVVSVLLSIMTGYGLLFLCAVPFTSMSQILPFIMFGIGLDDAFIISGAFFRTDHTKDPVQRIEDTIEDVGLSITLTTITSALAFGLGCISSIPAVYWLCLYAFPTILIDFLYQITFFVALLVLDERRVMEHRRDCCVWKTVPQDDDDDEYYEEEDEESQVVEETSEYEQEEQEQEGDVEDPEQQVAVVESVESDEELEKEENDEDDDMIVEYYDEPKTQLPDRIMAWYADRLLKKWVKLLVLVIFAALLGVCAWSASQLRQEFKFTDVVPKGSYVTDFFNTLEDYSQRGGVIPHAYFRFVDQSSTQVQQDMENYINDLVDQLKEIPEQPPFFWLRDFKDFVKDDTSLQNLTFDEQVDAFLSDSVYNNLYADQISRDSDGKVVASLCRLYMSNVDQEEVQEAIDALENQRRVTAAQPVNEGQSDWPFFTFSSVYYIWEFYSVAVDELILTTVLGVVAVSALGFVFIPHWTATLFVAPFIIILYVDLLGVLQFCGVKVNAVSYISLVMSIGLLVDFIMHGLLRYYECAGNRHEKVKEMLTTMGSSILVGGISTFLGVIPLAFSTSEIFFTIFLTFFGLVLLGITHGLILLPVVLSIFGTEECIRDPKLTGREQVHVEEEEDEGKDDEAVDTAHDSEW